MIITAVKPRDEIMTTTPVFWPMHLSIVLSIIVAFFACTALTLYRFRGRKPIMVFVLAIQMTSGGIIPQIIIYNQLGLLNKYSGLILAYIAMVLPFAIWNMRGFFLNIPKDIFESAAVEGANDWQILWKITIPTVMPSITICTFLTLTNSFKLFDQNMVLNEGRPYIFQNGVQIKTTEMLALNIYNTFYMNAKSRGVGQAKAVLFFILVAAIALIQLRATHEKEVQQ